MEARLRDILNTINEFYIYTDDMAHKYITLIEEAVDIIRKISAKPTSMLDNAKTETLYELCNELANRMNESFFQATPDRKKSEFKISKMLVTVAIGNVLDNISEESSE